MKLSIVILVNRLRLSTGRVQHAALALSQILDVRDVRLQEPLILRVDLDIVLDYARQFLHQSRFPLRIVEPRPRVLDPLDLIGDQAARQHAVRQPVPGISCGDVDPVVPGILADERHQILGLEDLARPFIVDAADLREALARPGLEFAVALLPFGLLPDFVVAAADDHVVVVGVAGREAHVFVGLGRVVDQAVFVRVLGDPDRDAVRAVVLQLGHHTQRLQRYARCLHGVPACDGVAGHGRHLDVLRAQVHVDDGDRDAALGARSHARVRVALEVGLLGQPLQHAHQVLRRVECRLRANHVAVALVRLSVPAFDRQVVDPRRVEARSSRCIGFLPHLRDVIVVFLASLGVLRYVIRLELSVFTVDAELCRDVSHVLQRPVVRLRCRFGALVSKQFGYLGESVVEVRRQMA